MKWLHNCCNKNVGLLVLRLVVGAIFLIHGWEKFANMEETIIFFGQVSLPAFWAYVVATIETLGGVLLIVGIFTRYVSILLSAIMVCAIALVKWPFTLLSLQQGIDMGQLPPEVVTLAFKAKQIFRAAEIDISLLGSLILLVTAGAGAYSLARWCKCKCNHGPFCKVCDFIGCEDVVKGKNCHNCNNCEGGTCRVEGQHNHGDHNHDHDHNHPGHSHAPTQSSSLM